MKRIFFLIFSIIIGISVNAQKKELENNLEEEPNCVQISPSLIEEDDIKEDVFTICEQMPEYPGGTAALLRYISSNFKYPMNGDVCAQGRIVVRFVVRNDGSVRNIKIIQGLHPEFDKEAIRVISEMSAWIPGKQNGVPVNVYYTLPIAIKY